MVLVWGPAHTDAGLASLYCSDINIQLINTTEEFTPTPIPTSTRTPTLGQGTRPSERI